MPLIGNHEDGLLPGDDHLVRVGVLVEVGCQKHGLLAQVAGPVRLNLLHVLVPILGVALRVNIVPLRSLQGRVPVALDLEVGVGDDYSALWVIEVSHRPRDQKVAQLHFEQLRFLVQEEERSVDGLDDDHRLLIGPEVTDHEVKSITLEV